MSKNNFNAKLKEITTHSDSAIKHPNMPVGEAVQEAENLVAWCQDDKETLIKAGLDWQLVDDLPTRAGACRYGQSIWARESQSREDAQKEWNTKSPQAFDLRDDLAVVLANANGEAGDDAGAKELRDKAYSYMKLAVDEIRATGQYLFWRDEDRRRGYVSSYYRRKNQARKPVQSEGA